jgi:hypothetical protein
MLERPTSVGLAYLSRSHHNRSPIPTSGDRTISGNQPNIIRSLSLNTVMSAVCLANVYKETVASSSSRKD